MAVIRELRAKFTAEAKALKKVMDDVKRSTKDLAKGQDGARKSMQGVGRESDAMVKRFKTADGRMMRLNRTTATTGKTFSEAEKKAAGLRKGLAGADTAAAGAGKTFRAADGRLATLNRSFLESNKTFRTTGGNLTDLGRHFSATEVGAINAGKQFKLTDGRMATLNRTASASVRTFKTTGGSITNLSRHFSTAETSAMTLGKQVRTATGGVSDLGTTVGKSAKTFRTSGGDIRTLGTHFSAAETNARLMGQSVSASGDTVGRTSQGIRRNVDSQISAPFAGAVQSVRNFTRSVRDIVASLGIFALIDKGIGMVRESLAGAIERYDTLNNFPRVLELMGFDADQSRKAINRLSEGIDGLPTKLDAVVGTAQRIAIITDDLDDATETTLALNNAFLASGTSAGDAERGLEQYVQMLSKGEVDLESWRSLQETMPIALSRTAKAFGFTGRSAQNDLYAALKDGKVTFDQFNKKIIELSEKTGGFADMARSSGAGIATSWTNMKTAFVRGTANIIKSADEALGGVGSIAGGIEKMKDGVNNSFKAMEKAVPPFVNAIQKYLMPSVRGVSNFARDYLVPSLKALYENLKPFAVMVGTALAGAFEAFVNALNNLLGPTIKYLSKMKLLGPILAGILGTMVGYKAAVLGVTAAQKISNAVTKVSIALSKAQRAAHLAMLLSGGGVRGMLLAMRAAMRALNLTMLANPFVLITTLIVGLGAALVAAYKKFDGFRKIVDDTWAFIKGAFKAGVSDAKDLIGIFTGHWTNMLEVWKALFSGDFPKAFELLKDGIQDVLSKIGGVFKKRFDKLDERFGDSIRTWTKSVADWADSIREKSPLIDAAFRGIEGSIGLVKAAIKEYIDVAKQVLPIYEEFVRTVAEGMKQLFSGDFKGAIKTFKEGYIQLFVDLKEIGLERLEALKKAIQSWILDTGDRIKDKLASWKDAFVDRLVELKDDVVQKFEDIGTAVLGWMTSLPGRIRDKFTEWKNAFRDKILEIRDEVSDKLDTIGTTVENFLTSMPGRIKRKLIGWGQAFNDWIMEQKAENERQFGEWGENILSYLGDIGVNIKGLLDKDWAGKIGGWFKDMPGKIGSWLGEWWSKIGGWISEKKTEWTTKLSEWTERIATWFHELPGRVGGWLGGFMGSIVKWIQDKKSEWTTNLSTWTERIVTWFRELPGRTAKALADWFTNIRTNVVNAKDRFVNSFNSWWDGLKFWFSNLGKKKEITDTGKNIIKNLAGGSEKEKPQLMDRIGKIIVDGIKYALLIGGVIALAVGRELIKQLISGVKAMKGAFDKAFANLVDIMKKKLKEMGTAVSKKWNEIWTGTTKFLGNVKSSFSTGWNAVKTLTSTALSGVVTTVKNKFNDIVQRAKDLPKRLGDGIGAMASKVTAGVTKVVNTLASTLGKGVNGVIGGVNWVLGKIGVKNTIPKWSVPKYARGTDGHPGGLAVVGDGKGAYKGQELIQHPDGTTYLSPDKDTLVNLPAGTQVLNAKDTQEALYPHYAKGIGSKIKGVASAAWDKTKEIGGKVKDAALDVFSYVKNPGKLLDLALSKLGISKPAGGDFAGWMAQGGWNKVKEGAAGYLKGMLEKFGGDFSGGKFRAPFRLTSRAGMRFHPIRKTWAMHWGDDYGAPYGTPIPSQSTGRVIEAARNAFRGNYLRIRSGAYDLIYQHLAKMFVGKGQGVTKGMTLGTVGSTGMSTGPHLHFETWKKGKFVPPVSLGFADGGIVDKATLAWIAEGGWAESIISHDPAKRVSQRAIWEQTGRELGFAQDNTEVVQLLMRIAQAVERGMNLSVIMKDREVGRILEPIITEIQKTKKADRERF